MRRPPDKDGHPVSDKDIDSSNATLNAFFGGARQKSWMLGPGHPVRPTPRNSISKPSGSAMLAQRTGVPVLLSPAPSDELNPVLPHNPVGSEPQIENRQLGYNIESQRPTAVPDQHPPRSEYRYNEVGIQLPQPMPIAQTQTQEQTRLPSFPSLSQYADAYRTSLPQIMDPPPPAPQVAASSLQPMLRTATAENDAYDQARYLSVGELRSPTPEAPSTDRNSEIRQMQQEYQAPLTSPTDITSTAPRSTSGGFSLPSSGMLQTQGQSYPNRGSFPSNPHKRQRTYVPTMGSLKGRIPLITAHVDSLGGIQNLNNGLERPRFGLLTDACNTEDSFYVALHQLFCVWDLRRADVTNIPNLPTAPILSVAFKILGQLIRDNEALALVHLQWFAGFPSPLADLMRASEPYRRTIKEVGAFLERLASDWAALSRICAARGYPPLIDEMVNRIRLLSPMLQKIIFTASRRNLGFSDTLLGEQIELVFAQDLQGHRELAARYHTGRPPTPREIRERNQKLIEKYLSLYKQLPQSRRGSIAGSPLAQSPIVPNADYPTPTNSIGSNPPFPSRTPDPSHATNQSFSNPDPSYQYQRQRAQPVRTTSSPNPTLNPLAGRPLSTTGFQVNPNTPSPTLLQGLSMHSPVVQSSQQPPQWSPPPPVLRSSNAQMQPSHNSTAYQSVYQAAPDQHAGQRNLPMPQPQFSHQHQIQQQMHQQTQQHSLTSQQQQQQQQQQRQQQVQQQQVQQVQQVQQHLQQQQQLAVQANRWHPQVNPQLYQQAVQQQQMQHHLVAQQVVGMNRAAQLRHESNSNGDLQQRVHQRNNSVSSAGRPISNINSTHAQFPRPPMAAEAYQKGQVPQTSHASQIEIYTQTPPLSRNLIPPLGFQHFPQPTLPDYTALHQSHIRSPALVPVPFTADTPEDHLSRRFYQFVKDFAMGPIKVPVTAASSKFEFAVSEASFALIAQDRLVGTDPLPAREFKPGSLQYRLRCIQTTRETNRCMAPQWIISDTAWPEPVFLEINSQQLEVRRKNHHGRDLPVDITRYIVPKSSPGNTNRIRLSIPRLRKVMRDSCYFVAVEVVEVLQHPHIMAMCQQYQRVSASTTLDAIKKSLAPPPSNDDDDFAMVVSDLSIDVADPFTARIFEIPVRGNSCLHRECFDLETFLLTRNSKPKRPGQPSMIDVWKCPLCGKDARPYSLQIDDFLVSVRAELASADMLDTKAILINANGTWRAKPEPRPTKRKAAGGLDDDEESSDDEGEKKPRATSHGANPTNNSSRVVEIIELDDD